MNVIGAVRQLPAAIWEAGQNMFATVRQTLQEVTREIRMHYGDESDMVNLLLALLNELETIGNGIKEKIKWIIEMFEEMKKRWKDAKKWIKFLKWLLNNLKRLIKGEIDFKRKLDEIMRSLAANPGEGIAGMLKELLCGVTRIRDGEAAFLETLMLVVDIQIIEEGKEAFSEKGGSILEESILGIYPDAESFLKDVEEWKNLKHENIAELQTVICTIGEILICKIAYTTRLEKALEKSGKKGDSHAEPRKSKDRFPVDKDCHPDMS
mmetsp:Transcript_37633/g.61249  ORF Transcript_37633/g.61249 Transcript_37633/m.61249 type:complete len:266 (+) Transcript_37633:104-901(+)